MTVADGGHEADSADPDGRRFLHFGSRGGHPRDALASPDETVSPDEVLMGRLALGDPDALGPLYARYARLVFTIAAHSLDRASAEELVQEVFLVVWRKAADFDPARGSFRSWLLEIAHSRILNELRRRGRRPHLIAGPAAERLNLLPDPDPEPLEAITRGQLMDAIHEALASLSPEQQHALRLAFFAEMTHEQVAATTAVPLGTAKSRIRSGLRRLRSQLNPLLVGGLSILLAVGAVVYQADHEQAARTARALRHVTLSDLQSVRLLATGDAPEHAHGVYRVRSGADIAVLTVSYLPPLDDGRAYQAWARIDGAWRSLGLVQPTGPEGRGLLIVEGADLGVRPEAVIVTEEPTGGSAQPSDAIVITWSASP